MRHIIQVDTGGAYRIRGDIDSDHNTILATIHANQVMTTEKGKYGTSTTKKAGKNLTVV